MLEEDIRQSRVVGKHNERTRTQGHEGFRPGVSALIQGVEAQVGMAEGLTVARGIPLPAEMGVELTQAMGAFEDVRARFISRPTQADISAPGGADIGLLAGLPGADPSIPAPPPGTVPFKVGDAQVAERIVAQFFAHVAQVQSEETGVATRSTVARAAQEQSEEVSRSRSIGTASEFAMFSQQAAMLQVLTTLGVGMAGLERSNLLGTQSRQMEPVRADQGRPATRTGTTGQLGRQGRIGVSSGSGDFKNFGSSIRGIGAIDRQFDTAVR